MYVYTYAYICMVYLGPALQRLHGQDRVVVGQVVLELLNTYMCVYTYICIYTYKHYKL